MNAGETNVSEGGSDIDVFISHAGSDQPLVIQLRQALVDAGLRTWVSFVDIPVGVQYPERIVRAIAQSRALVLMVSTASMRSDHVYREVVEAAERGKQILPIHVEPNVSVPDGLRYYLGTLNRKILSADTIDQAGPLVAACLSDPQVWLKEADAPGLLERLRASPRRALGASVVVAAAAGLTIWAMQMAWASYQQHREAVLRDAVPESLAQLRVVSAEWNPRSAMWQLDVHVIPMTGNVEVGPLRLTLRRRDEDGHDEVTDASKWINPAVYGGAQTLLVPMSSPGTEITACLTLAHPRRKEMWRVTAAFRPLPGQGQAQRLLYAPLTHPHAAPEDDRPCGSEKNP